MVKLKRTTEETQLDLFSWKPKNSTPVKQEYDGLSDTKESEWFTPAYLNKKYDEYNQRFFSGKLTKIPVYIKSRGSALGVCVGLINRRKNSLYSSEIYHLRCYRHI